MIFGIKKFLRFVYGRRFVLQADHRLLISIFRSKNRISAHKVNRLLCWRTILLNYDFQMEYVPSKYFGRADGLSSQIPKYCEPLEDTVIVSLCTESEIKDELVRVRKLPVTAKEIKVNLERDDSKKKMKGQVKFKEGNTTDLSGCNYWCISS